MTKTEAREKYRKMRDDLSNQELVKQTDLINQHLIDFNFQFETVHLFLPIKKFNEIDLSVFRNYCYDNGKTVCTSISNFNDFTMTSLIIEEHTELTDNKWGIPEPTIGQNVESHLIDLVIVPLLYCDSNGSRVGYGKGFYDRFLMTCKREVIKCGVNYFLPNELIENSEETDVKLNWLITPEKVVNLE